MLAARTPALETRLLPKRRLKSCRFVLLTKPFGAKDESSSSMRPPSAPPSASPAAAQSLRQLALIEKVTACEAVPVTSAATATTKSMARLIDRPSALNLQGPEPT